MRRQSGVCVVAVALSAAVSGHAHAESGAPVAPAERLTLTQAIERALARNPDALVAQQAIERAEGLLTQARAAGRPALSGTGQYTRLDHDRYTSTGIRIGAANQWSGTLNLTVPVFVPNSWAGVHRATSARNQAVASAADVRRELAAAVARAYLGVVLQRRQGEVAVRARDTARAHFDFARTRLTGGVGTSLDDARAEQELRADEVQLASARAAEARARAALETLLASDRPIDVVDEVVLPAAPELTAATDEARGKRPDIKVLETRLRGAENARRDVWALYAPYLTANGLAFEQDLGSAFQPRRGWQAQLVLTLPFYDGGARGGVRRERDANQEEARVQLEAGLRQVGVEIRTAYEVLRHADEGLASARQAAELARKAAELAELAYRAGATTNLELIDAERRARDAESQAALAEDAARQARLDLLLASGRFP